MDDTISRQAALDASEKFIKDCNPEHFVGHQKFIEYMDNVEIGSFGNWQFANGFNMGLTAAEVAIEKLPSAQPDCSDCIEHGGDWDCDHVHCHKGKFTQPEILACGEGELNVTDTNTRDVNQKGEWKECGTIMIEGYKGCLKECSKCHSVIVGYGNFCPVCGAKME